MTLECINPPDLPTPDTYTQVVVAAKGTKLIFVAGQEPKMYTGSLLAEVISRFKHARCSPTSVEPLQPQVPFPSKQLRLRSTSSSISATTTYPFIQEARVTLFGNRKPADVVLELLPYPPAT